MFLAGLAVRGAAAVSNVNQRSRPNCPALSVQYEGEIHVTIIATGFSQTFEENLWSGKALAVSWGERWLGWVRVLAWLRLMSVAYGSGRGCARGRGEACACCSSGVVGSNVPPILRSTRSLSLCACRTMAFRRCPAVLLHSRPPLHPPASLDAAGRAAAVVDQSQHLLFPALLTNDDSAPSPSDPSVARPIPLSSTGPERPCTRVFYAQVNAFLAPKCNCR